MLNDDRKRYLRDRESRSAAKVVCAVFREDFAKLEKYYRNEKLRKSIKENVLETACRYLMTSLKQNRFSTPAMVEKIVKNNLEKPNDSMFIKLVENTSDGVLVFKKLIELGITPPENVDGKNLLLCACGNK